MQCDFPFMIQSQMVPDLNSMSHQTHLTTECWIMSCFLIGTFLYFSQVLAENKHISFYMHCLQTQKIFWQKNKMYSKI